MDFWMVFGSCFCLLLSKLKENNVPDLCHQRYDLLDDDGGAGGDDDYYE